MLRTAVDGESLPPCGSTDLCQQETVVKATNHHVLAAALLQLSSFCVVLQSRNSNCLVMYIPRPSSSLVLESSTIDC
jgi:hypothetical protein